MVGIVPIVLVIGLPSPVQDHPVPGAYTAHQLAFTHGHEELSPQFETAVA